MFSKKLLGILLGTIVIGGIGIGAYLKKTSEKPSPSTPTSPTAITPQTDYISQIPGVDLVGLSEEKKKGVLDKANQETCSCGCIHSLAFCVTNDPGCPIVNNVKETIQNYAKEARGG